MADRNSRKVTMEPLTGTRRKQPDTEHDEQRPAHAPKQWVESDVNRKSRPTGAPKTLAVGRDKGGVADRGGPSSSRAAEQRPKIQQQETIPDKPQSRTWTAQGSTSNLKKNWGPDIVAAAAAAPPMPLAREPPMALATASSPALKGKTSSSIPGATPAGAARGTPPGLAQGNVVAIHEKSPLATSRQARTSPASSALARPMITPRDSPASRERSPAIAGSAGSVPRAPSTALTVAQESPSPRRRSPSHGRETSATPARSGSGLRRPTSSIYWDSDTGLAELRHQMHELHDRPTDDNYDRIVTIMEINRARMSSAKKFASLEQVQYDQLVEHCRIGASHDLRLSAQQHAKMVKLQKGIDRYDAVHDVLVFYDDHLGRLLFAAQEEHSLFKAMYEEFKSDLLAGSMSDYLLDDDNFASGEQATSQRSDSPSRTGPRTSQGRASESQGRASASHGGVSGSPGPAARR